MLILSSCLIGPDSIRQIPTEYIQSFFYRKSLLHFNKAFAYLFHLPLSNLNIVSLVPFQCASQDMVWMVFKVVLTNM